MQSLGIKNRLQRKCTCGGTPGPSGECDECRKKRLQRQSSRERPKANAAESKVAPPIVDQVLKLSGEPLNHKTRATVEQLFGFDFSNVRVHTDSRAANSARAVNATAYTIGRQNVFDSARYEPGTVAGKSLLAHELAHIVQQSNEAGSSPRKLPISPENSAAEEQANRAAERGLDDTGPGPIQTRIGTPISVQRLCSPAAVCAAPIPGSAGEFGASEEAKEAGPRDERKKQTPAKAVADGHSGRAGDLEKFFKSQDPTASSNIHGIIFDRDLSAGTGAMIQKKNVTLLATDELEQQADRAAHGAATGKMVPHISSIQASPDEQRADFAPKIVHQVLESGGQALDAKTLAKMSRYFGHDFGRVRVHADAQAAESAKVINAQAYTVGPDIVFGSGRFSPATEEGGRLLTHELTHVVQQRAAPMFLQRDDKPKPAQAPKDVIVLLDSTLEAAAKTIASDATILRPSSPEDLAKNLKAIKHPINRLLFFGHADDSATIKFPSGWTPPAKLSKAVEGAVPVGMEPALADFRGCRVGMSPPGMEQIRAALRARAAVGATCWIVTKSVGPFDLGQGDVVSPTKPRRYTADELKPGIETALKAFDKARKCVLDTSIDAYFRAGGKFVAAWFSPIRSGEFDPLYSRCSSEVKPRVVDPTKVKKGQSSISHDCQLLEVDVKP
jgi:Domain of unknown function (DUF4157)